MTHSSRSRYGHKPRVLAIGDIHGRYGEMEQALERAGWRGHDRLVFLGDYVDRGPDSKRVVDTMISWTLGGLDVIALLGNHDDWVPDGLVDPATKRSYGEEGVSYLHELFFRSRPRYHVQRVNGDRCLFVHGGYLPGTPMEEQDPSLLIYDRTLWESRWEEVEEFDRVFVGHTPVFGDPEARGVVTNLDTGAGFEGGRVTVMDVATGEFWQSDQVREPWDGSCAVHDVSVMS